MKKFVTTLILFVVFALQVNAQTSPDYIFGDNNGSGWNWSTGTPAQSYHNGSYKWQFLDTLTNPIYFKFGEDVSNANGAGFWYVGTGTDVQYTTFGAKWTAEYHANMNDAGAFYINGVKNKYYVVKTQKQAGNNADFAIFESDSLPRTISSVSRTISGSNLTVTATMNKTLVGTEKVWVRYSTNNFGSTTTVELLPTTGTNYAATLALNPNDFVMFYVYTTLNVTTAPAEVESGFYAINFNNNNGKYYQAQLGTFAGDYYIPQGNNSRGFASLNAALLNLKEGGISGNVNFYFTADLSEPENVALGLDTKGFTITFKPAPGVQPTITFTKLTDNAGASGNWVIGAPDITTTSTTNYNLTTTENIIIDGSNTVGGTTRDLTIQNVATAHANSFVVRFIGDVNNCILKNTNVKQISNNATYAVALVNRLFNSIFYTPDNITIDNNLIQATGTKGQAFAVTTSGTFPATWIGTEGLVVKNNLITASGRGIFLNGIGGTSNIFGNEIQMNQMQTATTTHGIWGFVVDSAAIINIYNNKITKLQSPAATVNFYTVGIELGNNVLLPYTANVYNNTISGFVSTMATGTTEMYGIRATANAAPAVNAYHNTILMDNLTNTGGTVTYAGFYVSKGKVDFKNNIIKVAEDDFRAYGIRKTSTPTLTSDFNNVYLTSSVNSQFGIWDTTNTATLAAWQTASLQDTHSVSKDVIFASATDLHLAGASIGDKELAGTPIASVLFDIDNEVRDLSSPYMGADEGSVALPVELNSFLASVAGNAINLNWKTSTETNSFKFEVERKEGSNWTKIGEVRAANNSTSPKEYSYSDKNLSAGRYEYRLRMVDLDGTFTYSNIVEGSITVPNRFELSQNYPNPFNPSTTINYNLPVDSKVMLAVYSITGEKVAELVNDFQTAGAHTIVFDASSLANGTYIYRLTAGSFTQTKKMVLLK